MSGAFYPKLAVTNIRKNSRNYVPYIITCIFTIAMYYMLKSLSLNKGLEQVFGAETMTYTLSLGCYVLAIFSFIFLFYTNSFLMKNRRKEFGLFNILGMEKKHIARVNFYESLFVAILSLAGGLVTGMILDKLMYLFVVNIMKTEISLGFYISGQAIKSTLIIFSILFLLIFLNSIRLIHFSKPIELLKGGHTGEKEPKAKWITAILGIACLGTGYYIAVTVKNPLNALTLFFLAVLLVIAGTYMLFSSVSITFLKILKMNKRYYYKTSHFISISGMMYRMKQNAAGLANICILSTMVLVMVSSTTSLMLGVEDIMLQRYPYQLQITLPASADEEILEGISQIADKTAKEENVNITKKVAYANLEFAALYQGGNEFIVDLPRMEASMSDLDYLHELNFITAADYSKHIGKNVTLEENEVILYSNRTECNGDSFTLFGKEYKIIEKTDDYLTDGFMLASMMPTFGIVIKDMDVLKELEEKQREVYGKNASALRSYCLFDTDAEPEDTISIYYKLNENLEEFCHKADVSYRADCREYQRTGLYGLYGGLFFIGIYLGLMFTVATVLIIYYKQISEGMDDKERFEIMQKVGMSEQEVKGSIRSQVLTVFFMPLITAGIHTAFAFPIVRKILLMFSLNNIKLFIACNVFCYLAFALIYAIVYILTAKVYYRIIRRKPIN